MEVNRRIFIMKENKTINYYNSNVKEFVSGTVSVDFESTQKSLSASYQKTH